MAAQKNVGDVISQTTVPASTLTPQPLPPSTENGNKNSISAPPAAAQGNEHSSRDYTIEIPPPTAADDAKLVHDLARIVNEVYIGAEVGIWQDGFQRTSAPDIEKLIRAGELAVAYFHGGSDSDDEADRGKEGSSTSSKHQRQQPKPVGCVCIQKIRRSSGTTNAEEGKQEEIIGEFGMLALDERHRGSGLGRDMVRFAEERCRTGLGVAAVQLELLFPTGFEHAFKVRLAGWYGRMGYEQMCVRDFADDHPELAPLLAGPCEYRVFEKRLV
ncbi:hypothetical protein SLS62_005988 [Diatrype stigma]|uniref:N-acetyltransferase domain-containing protein n=1 Tax=Diatrype stigma TaxID=117547 RepID=A0AAN9UNR8_9PEZI